MAKRNQGLIIILTIGVFGILNTEMGIIGLLPAIADHFEVSVSQAGWLVSAFALAVAVSGPILPLVLSGIDRKKIMLLVLGVFVLGNIVSIFASNLSVALIARVIPALLHPVYCSLAFSVAAASVSEEEAPKAVSKVFIGVSAGMVIGVPIANFLASAVSLQIAMIFFAAVNLLAFAATLLFVPALPVKQRLSYGTQLSILKKGLTWISIVAIILLNGAVFGVYSYLAEYLQTVTKLSANTVSAVLFLFGGANIIGNIAAGKLLTNHARKSLFAFPFALGAVYILLFFTGQFTVPMAILTFIWGILAGIGANMNQYLMMSSAPEAPDFANGLFLTAANLGVTIGAAVGGIWIAAMGTPYVVIAGLLSLLFGLVAIARRNALFTTARQHSK
ncbi:MFS transporter [Paenibacillus aurantiacus]|uniref:MFS transporter n=1 Tax=Paenibacillus aurantiacus TaxID=1936118 RepID=A0ABV5KKC4_9BACL